MHVHRGARTARPLLISRGPSPSEDQDIMRNVLTADRSSVVRAVVERHLERFGCLAVEATNAAEAIAEARERPLALMVVDAGVHAAASRESDPAYDAVPIVLLTTDHPASAPDPGD